MNAGCLDAYLSAAGHREEKGTPLFRSADGKTGRLKDKRLSQHATWYMLQRRAAKAGIDATVTNHCHRQ